MKKYTLFVALIVASLAAVSQPKGERNPREQIEAAKIALITERLQLTPAQAEKFWPIYNEYSRRQEEVRREFTQARNRHNPETASDDDNKRLLELGMQVKERTIELERTYSERLLQVIDNRQMLSLRKAESDFKVMILNRLREQQQRRQQMQERQQGNQDLQRRRN